MTAPASPSAEISKDASTALIEGAGIEKTFKDFWGRPKVKAVRGVDIRVRKGAIFGLLGPNGAGKSTLMKLILGHLYPTAGRLQIFGKPPTDVETKSRLGYLPERAYLYKNLTPEETLRFFGDVLELPPAEIKSRTGQLLDMVGLNESRKRLVGEFSHGMMRRMGLAQALLNDPDLLLLDEPTAGLDPLGCREVKNLILTLAKRGKTIVLTSHLLSDVEDVCDEIMIMYGGKVLANGPVHDLLARKDVLQVRMPAPTKERMEQLREVLKSDVPANEIEFSSPTRSLESYFVDVVRQASEGGETDGAQIGKGVADYLRDGVEEDEATLEALTHTSAASVKPEPTPQADAKAAEEAAVDVAALDSLSDQEAAVIDEPEDDDNSPDIDEDLLDNLTK